MKIIDYAFILWFLLSCSQGRSPQSDSKDHIDSTQIGHLASTIDVNLFGHHIHCAGECDELVKEFERICQKDENLSFDTETHNINIYGTLFHLNMHKRDGHLSFSFMSSVQPDSKQIKKVREGISKFHGKENFEEDGHYSWIPSISSDGSSLSDPIIHLRRVRSEEGGTVILVIL